MGEGFSTGASSQDVKFGDKSYGGISGGSTAVGDTGFSAAFWGANPGTGASSIVQGIASIPFMGWLALGATVIVIGIVLLKRK